ncbi:Asp23/Gls24 family envelope stress response protein [Frondihabitans sp. VKM Ac-2883]|uniref:Asp23/Gls24 family envelope stress response protein n=1 Tax=Frondihabitans sp. VKM Ac-2883 TaxID=2783823 RepID=UPI00188A08EA|nr:Asp23/Gls24 family envelope stress response protein [Frondihabitans sp. VKM Ac-2883]MBF4577129.1 Asp23/Gls24 family envelope stress response protein [Frondihabitans sp. VKM Ac-2883]
MADTKPTVPTPTSTSRVDKVATPVTTTSSAVTASAATGKTVIADSVISKVAGIAAREVPGVYALGGGAARAFGAIRDVIGSTDLSQGVRVEVGETQVAADVTIVVEYPVPMNSVAEQVRVAVAQAITELVGMEVAEINVAINDVHIPGDDDDNDDQPAESRVS